MILYSNNLEKELVDVLIILEDESIKIIFKIVKCIFDIKLLFKFNDVYFVFVYKFRISEFRRLFFEVNVLLLMFIF